MMPGFQLCPFCGSSTFLSAVRGKVFATNRVSSSGFIIIPANQRYDDINGDVDDGHFYGELSL